MKKIIRKKGREMNENWWEPQASCTNSLSLNCFTRDPCKQKTNIFSERRSLKRDQTSVEHLKTFCPYHFSKFKDYFAPPSSSMFSPPFSVKTVLLLLFFTHKDPKQAGSSSSVCDYLLYILFDTLSSSFGIYFFNFEYIYLYTTFEALRKKVKILHG